MYDGILLFHTVVASTRGFVLAASILLFRDHHQEDVVSHRPGRSQSKNHISTKSAQFIWWIYQDAPCTLQMQDDILGGFCTKWGGSKGMALDPASRGGLKNEML